MVEGTSSKTDIQRLTEMLSAYRTKALPPEPAHMREIGSTHRANALLPEPAHIREIGAKHKAALLRAEPPHLAEVGSKHREALQRDAMQSAGRGIPSAVAPARSRGMPEDPTPLGIPKRVSDVWRLADRIAHGGLSPEDWSRLLGQIGGGVDYQELESFLCPGPGLRLLAWKNACGARAAIEHVFELVLPTAITETYAEQIVDHFVNGDLLLPWELTSWWQCKHEILPSHSAVPTTPEPPPLPWTEDDKAKLNLIALGLYLFDAELYSKYGHYFHTDLTSYDAKPAILLGVIRAADIDEAWSTIVEQLIQALTHLNALPPVPSDDSIPVATSLFFAEFDEPPMNPDGRTVSKMTMRKIWARRLAVALWADVNAHWPWSLDELPIDLRNALLGWNPRSETAFEGACANSDSVDTWDCIVPRLVEGLTGQNSQGIWGTNVAATGIPAGYSGGFVWSPDPLSEWLVAFYGIRPRLGDSPASRKDGVLAAHQWLLDRTYVHDKGDPKDNTLTVHPGFTSFKSLVLENVNYGGCSTTGPLFVALLRAMNIPALSLPNLPTVGRAYSWNMDQISKGQPNGHTSVVCRLPEGSFAVFHADYICSYMGQRYGDPVDMWIPYAEWFLVHLILWGDFLKSPENAVDQVENMLTKHWYAMTLKQISNMASNYYHGLDEGPEHPYWLVRVLMAVTDAELNGGTSWLTEWSGSGDKFILASKFLKLGINQFDMNIGVPHEWHSGGQYSSALHSKTATPFPLNWKFTNTFSDDIAIQASVSNNPDSADAILSIGLWLNNIATRIIQTHGTIESWRNWLIKNGCSWYGCPDGFNWLCK